MPNVGTHKRVSSIVAVKYMVLCVRARMCERAHVCSMCVHTCVLIYLSVIVCNRERLGISLHKHWRKDTGEKTNTCSEKFGSITVFSCTDLCKK